ncbi:short chain dehydrogenase [Dactylonectria estremocensis]|uniref:Short chain dehydrogenase n=1 Tax=Dactylonectria estremocensis TaxID=1079267 RepID=A0A9P9EM90_9HYPO|nr:short chain dehydrogenase [Dactylonectria estremocensis]
MTSHPVILITAGTAGLGAAVARLFAKNGFGVVVNYNSDTARAETLLAELNKTPLAANGSGPKHMVIKANLASQPDVSRLVQETYQSQGRIDVVFSNGGWTKFRDTSQIDDNVFEEDWDLAFTMNVKSHLWLLYAAKDRLEQTEGAFITTSSIAGISGMGSSLAYAATKAAQLHMVKGLASMVAPKIRVNSVSPGLLETDWAKRFSSEQKEQHRMQTKLKRFVQVKDVAHHVLTLAKSRSTTGINIVVDAGYTV